MKRLFIFDLDGTVLDTLEDLADALNAALTAHGFPRRTLEEVRRMVGNGIGNLVARGVQEGRAPQREETVAAVLATFREHYAAHCRDKTKPYPGIVKTLEALKGKGHTLALASNKADFAVQELCRTYFSGMFHYVTGERPDVPRKPAPDVIHNIQAALDFAPAQCVYVGDSEVDVATAQNAGVDLCAVTWGFRSREELEEAGAVRLADTPEELEAILSAM